MTGQQVYFDDVKVGQAIPEVRKGPMTVSHIMRWSASMENWHRIHYDKVYAMEHDKLPNVVVNGSWKQHILMQVVKDWAGLGLMLCRLAHVFSRMSPSGGACNRGGWSTFKARKRV